MMGSPELATAMMYGINVVTIVVNDEALSAIKGSQQKGCNGRTIDTDLSNPDFIQFAKSFGAYAVRVDEIADFKGRYYKMRSLRTDLLLSRCRCKIVRKRLSV